VILLLRYRIVVIRIRHGRRRIAGGERVRDRLIEGRVANAPFLLSGVIVLAGLAHLMLLTRSFT
jgi:hypothetical protein